MFLTLKHEHMLSKHYTSYFAFAEEKLDELAQLKELAQCEDYHSAPSYQANTKLFAQARDCVNEDVHQRLSRITEDDYIKKTQSQQAAGIAETETCIAGISNYNHRFISPDKRCKKVKAIHLPQR